MPIVNDATPPSSPRGDHYEIVQITANTTLTENHRDRVLQVNGTVTLTLPNDLPVGFHCKIEQYGSGAVTLTAASGATLNNAYSVTATASRYEVADLFVTLNSNGLGAVYNLSGIATATAAELDILSGATVTTAELNLLDNVVASVSWAVAAGASNVCVFTGTIKDAAGATIAASRPIDLYISEAVTGIGITGDTYSTGASITTGTQLIALTANKAWRINTHTDGTFAISITDTAKPADQYAVAIVSTTGKLSISAASAALWGA